MRKSGRSCCQEEKAFAKNTCVRRGKGGDDQGEEESEGERVLPAASFSSPDSSSAVVVPPIKKLFNFPKADRSFSSTELLSDSDVIPLVLLEPGESSFLFPSREHRMSTSRKFAETIETENFEKTVRFWRVYQRGADVVSR